MVDIALWNVWEQVACPVLILRGEDSDLLHASTVREMQKRGIAGKNGLVRAVEVHEVGHAPPLMSDAQISLIEEFLADERVTSKAQISIAVLRALLMVHPRLMKAEDNQPPPMLPTSAMT